MLWLDTETFSRLNLKEVGGHRYAYHKSTRVLLLPYAFDNDAPKCIEVGKRSLAEAIKAEDMRLYNYLVNSDGEICFHNSQFDRWVMDKQGITIPTRRIKDTMVIAYTLSLPGNLAQLCASLNLPEEMHKQSDGQRLIQMFCSPTPSNVKLRDTYNKLTHPEEWEKFIQYAKMDIVSMRECYKRMPKWNFNETEQSIWLMDQKINDRGVRIDTKFVGNAIRISDQIKEEGKDELSRITNGDITGYAQTDRMLKFCADRGVSLPDMRKETVAATLRSSGWIDSDAERVLQLRLSGNKAAVSKYTASKNRTSRGDFKLRGGIQYGGASRTLRWAGRGLQLHNFARPEPGLNQDQAARLLLAERDQSGTWPLVQQYEEPLDVIKSIVRGMFIPSPGNSFVISDLSNIEGRVTAWISGEEWKVQAFRDFDAGKGPDIYLKTYSESFGKPIDQVTKDDRQIGKVQELAGGYQGWIGAWETFSTAYGLEPRPEEEVIKIMGSWRDAHPEIRATWGRLQRTFAHAFDHPEKGWRCGGHLSFRYYPRTKKQPFGLMLVRLPSGRYVPYIDPYVRYDAVRDQHKITYMGLNDKGMWIKVDTYGGKLLENIVQAISRDILANAMLTLESHGYEIVLHVHDEVVIDDDGHNDHEDTLEFVNQVLSTPPSWAPDLPLNAEGSIEDRYKKA